MTQREKQIDLLAGFVGWFLLNSILWTIFPADGTLSDPFWWVPIVFLPLNLLLLILFAVYRRWVGLGILTALALNFVISLLFGMVANGVCGVPVWFPL